MSLIKRGLTAALLVVTSLLPAQTLDSRSGGVHTPEGDLHMLVIFIRYEGRDLMPNNNTWPDTTAEGYLPDIAKGESNAFFHARPEDIGERSMQNLSDFYYAMSGGRFRITGEVYSVQVPVDFIPERNNNFFTRQGQMNQAALNWIAAHDPEFDWARFDRRTNRPQYKQSNVNTPPDSILDYVVFMHRAPGSTGMGASSNVGIPGTYYRILDGHTGIKSYTNNKHNWLYFLHEFAHNLYSSPHYLGANGADGDRFYTQKGWGMMAAWHSPFFIANAWEAWWLGWIECQQPDSSGEYLLRDYVTGRDAMRIPIPGTQDFLWLENHQKKDRWDEKLFFKDTAQHQPQSPPGLYAYVVGAPGSDRSRPQLNPFAASSVNFIRLMNADGNHDWRFAGDSLPTGYFRAPVMEKVAPNPISGQHAFQFLRADYNGDGQIGVGFSHGNTDSGGREQMDLWAERREGADLLTIANTGDAGDAFGPGRSLGLSTLSPVTGYPLYHRAQDSLAPYVLSGIRIEVLDTQPDGTMRLRVELNDWKLRGNLRWSGQMQIPDSNLLGRSVALELVSGTTLTLGLSGTPQRQKLHPVTGTFAPPTRLMIGAGQQVVVEKDAVLLIEEHSHLVLGPGARLVVMQGGSVRLAPGASVQAGPGAVIRVNNFANILTAEGSMLLLDPGSQLIKSWLGRVKK